MLQEGTTILVAVKAEIGSPDPTYPDWGRVEFFVDWWGMTAIDQ